MLFECRPQTPNLRGRFLFGQVEDDSMRALMSAAVLLLISIQPPSGPEPLRLVQTIALPRVEGRIDHLALDPTGQKLFVAALGNNTVEVVDVPNGAHIKSLPGFGSV
jgi:hypothetical protein